ncbi:MAG: GNAT family N-acetyltransferase, partial [Verrucomicrobiae bacterium]|nr:GNAT family N-acetyltransferase [Verrucomicrobiae bacterium]
MRIRRIVFIEEQGVSEALEIDGRDPECVHALARDGSGEVIGTARLLPEGKIGRVAV